MVGSSTIYTSVAPHSPVRSRTRLGRQNDKLHTTARSTTYKILFRILCSHTHAPYLFIHITMDGQFSNVFLTAYSVLEIYLHHTHCSPLKVFLTTYTRKKDYMNAIVKRLHFGSSTLSQVVLSQVALSQIRSSLVVVTRLGE